MLKKKKNEITVGTNNDGKLKEIKDLLPKNYLISSPKEHGYRSPIENGKTFKENSLIKAKYFYKKSKKVCIADDSGLEIDALNKEPGIYSARWAGKKNDFNLAINKIFNKLYKIDKNWKKKNISARFICALTIYGLKKNLYNQLVLSKVGYQKKKSVKKVLDMIQSLFPTEKN